MPMGERAARKQIEQTAAEIEEWLDSPHGEEQSIIDHLERPIYDEDFDDDWIDQE